MNIKVISSGSSGNAYIVNDGDTTILLDCGVPVGDIQKACNFNLNGIDCCLLSHEHGDHSKSANKLAKRGINIVMHPETAKAIHAEGHRIRTLKNKESIEVGTFKIMAFDLVHDCPNLGFLLLSMKTHEKLVYITDTAYCRYKFKNLTHIMIEANNDKDILRQNAKDMVIPESLRGRIIETHMEINTTIEFLKANYSKALQRVYLLHLSDRNSNEIEFYRKAAEATGTEVVVC